MLAIACSTLSEPPRIVDSSLIAVVCNGIASRKWRTISTSAKAVQPWLPWNSGRQRSTPRNASAPPSAGLSFSGLTVQALCGGDDRGHAGGRPRSRPLPGRRCAHLRPDRVVQLAVDLADQRDHAVVAGVAVVALLVDVEPGRLALQRHELGAAAGQQDVGLAGGQHPVHLLGRDLADHGRIVAHQLLDPLLVLVGRFAHRGADDDHADLLEGGDHRPRLDAAGVEQHPLAGEPRPAGRQRCPGTRLLLGDQRLGAGRQIGRRAARHQQARQGAQAGRGIADAIERALEVGDVPALLHLARQRDQRLAADHHVDAGAVRRGDLVVAGVAGDRRQHADAEAGEQRLRPATARPRRCIRPAR